MSAPAEGLFKKLSLLLFALVGACLLLTFRAYGPTWDEEVQAAYGDLVLRFYTSLFSDRSALTFRDLYLYGGAFEALAQAVARVLPFPIYDSRHLVNGLFGLVGLIAVWRTGSRLGGPRGGFWAALFLAATPRYYGHMLNNPKDIPFAALAALYLDAAVLALEVSPRVPVSRILRLGLTLGAALAVRVAGLVLPLCLLVVLVVFPLRERGLKDIGSSVWKLVLLPTVIAWPLMLIFWPWALLRPWSRPFLALSALARGGAGWLVFFDGAWVSTNAPPASFVPVWLLNTLPEFYGVVLLGGAVLAWGTLRHGGRGRYAPIALLVVAVVLPPVCAVVLHSRQYDAARHFLFLLAPLAVLAGVSASRLWVAGRVGKASVALALACLLATVFEMVRLHPYQYVYFNHAVAGGLPRASEKFQLDYWGMSYKEGTEWLLAHYRPTGRVRTRPILVANCSLDFLTGGILAASPRGRTEFQEVRKRDAPHVFLALRNEECDIPLEGPILHVVEREGVPLLEIHELRTPS
jgi:hypothetical protein